MHFKMNHSDTKNAKSRVRQSQVSYLHTTHYSALKVPTNYYVNGTYVSSKYTNTKHKTCIPSKKAFSSHLTSTQRDAQQSIQLVNGACLYLSFSVQSQLG